MVERYDYTAYGEPTILAGATSGSELGNVLASSAVGNPLMHQRLFRDTEVGAFHNRLRELRPELGRWTRCDPLDYSDGMNRFEYVHGGPFRYIDAFATQTGSVTSKPHDEEEGGHAGTHLGETVGELAGHVVLDRTVEIAGNRSGLLNVETKTIGAAATGALKVIEASQVMNQAMAHSGKPARSWLRTPFLVHVEGTTNKDGESEENGPDEHGVGRKPFDGGVRCGMCNYKCDCHSDGTASAIVVCAVSSCSGRMEFSRPRDNPCTFYCEQMWRRKPPPFPNQLAPQPRSVPTSSIGGRPHEAAAHRHRGRARCMPSSMRRAVRERGA